MNAYEEMIARNGPDELDRRLLRERMRIWDSRQGPRVGDFVYLPGEVDAVRFTCVGVTWEGDSYSVSVTTPEHAWSDSFYVDRRGRVDHSGRRLFREIPKSELFVTGEEWQGPFWFFHHDVVRPGGRIEFSATCRVYQSDGGPSRAQQAAQRHQPRRRGRRTRGSRARYASVTWWRRRRRQD